MMNVEIKKSKKMSKEEALDLKKKCEAVLAFLKEFYFSETDAGCNCGK